MRLIGTSHGRRVGTVTVIVISFIVLLLIMGMAAAFYGLREAEEAKVYRDGANGGQTGVTPNTRTSSGNDQPPEPDAILNRLLASVIYPAPDDQSGAFNSLRGHEISRTIYGWNPGDPLGATQPYVGVGRVTPDLIYGGLGLPPAMIPPAERINWGWMPDLGQMLYEPHSNWIRDPRTNTPPAPATYRYYAPNANYTYPDLNNLYLAAIDPYSGAVKIPSFHRPWHIGNVPPPQYPATSPTPAVYTADANPWTNDANQPTYGRYRMLRPRPVEHQWPAGSGLSEFRYPTLNPDGSCGDVKNLDGAPGGNDSIWVDLDYPVQFWQGKYYKPLFAVLIVDLDNRINLNVAGNYYAADPSMPPHSSGQGIGPWEINPEKVLRWTGPGLMPPGWNEGRQVVLGPPIGNLGAHHRLGEVPTPLPNPPIRIAQKKYTSYSNEWVMFANIPTPGSGAYHYAAADYDGRALPGSPKYSDASDGHATSIVFGPPYQGTGMPGDPPPARPNMNSRYQNGMYIPGVLDERSHHPSLFNPYLVRSNHYLTLNPQPRSLPNRVFGVEELRLLNAKYNYGDYSNSDLARLAPATLGKAYYMPGELNPRFAVTPLSTDLDIPGSTPWRSTPGTLSLTGLPPNQPTGSAPTPLNLNTPNPSMTNAEDFDPASFRAKLTSMLGPIDIDRKLTDFRNDASLPYTAANFDGAKAARANADRQALAKDIFDRLRFVTTGALPTQPLPAYPGPGIPNPNFDGHRWLAQLAVNIVDYIDNDDYMSPFNWNPSVANAPADASGVGNAFANQAWVFGFERPRLLINEAYGRFENDPADPAFNQNPPTAAQNPYIAKFWVELHNPLTPANAAELGIQSDSGAALLYNSVGGYSPYRLSIVTQQCQQQLDQLDNVLGTVNNMGMQQRELASTTFIAVDGNNMTHDKVAPNQLDQGGQGYTSRPQQPNNPAAPPAFFLVASEKNLPDDTNAMNLQANRTDTNFKYTFSNVFDPGNNNAEVNERAPRILLRRLANPHLPPGQFNPYVTVDYFKFDRLMMNNALSVDNNGMTPKGKGKGGGLLGQQIVWSQNRAYGRRQPYAACKFPEPAQVNDLTPYMQRPDNDPAGNPLAGTNGVNAEFILHTLGRHNGRGDTWAGAGDTLDQPFQPLVHLDRILISPVELLHVSAVRPFHLTHAFASSYDQVGGRMMTVDPVTKRQFYTANWLDDGVVPNNPGLYLWRALEFLKASIRHEGMGMGGRVPGRININTNFSAEVFAAVADWQAAANRFAEMPAGIPGTVASAWNAFGSTRMPSGPPVPGAPGPWNFGPDNRPLWGLATAVSPAGAVPATATASLDQRQTMVMPNALYATGPVLGNFDESFTSGAGGNAGTLQKFELMSKVFNNFTTRSNCFAMYATVGYFEVRNPGPWNEFNRPVLGKEIGADSGTEIRHRFFSIIDRTNLTIELPTQLGIPVRQGPAPVYLPFQPNTPLPMPGAPPTGNNNALIPDPIYQGEPAPGLLMELRIPIIGQEPPVLGGGLLGHYDGTVWTIRPGLTWLQIDVGDRQELVQVPALPGAVRIDPFSPTTGIISVYVMKQHYRGTTMRLVNPDPTLQGAIVIGMNPPIPTTVPGNPGPQPGFNYKSPRYAGVVRYAEELK